MWAAVAVSDPAGELQTKKGEAAARPGPARLRELPLAEDIDEYLAREVLPHVPDAWIAEVKDPVTGEKVRAKIGYEIPFTRLFYLFTPPRPLTEIDAELRSLESQIQALLAESSTITRQLLDAVSDDSSRTRVPQVGIIPTGPGCRTCPPTDPWSGSATSAGSKPASRSTAPGTWTGMLLPAPTCGWRMSRRGGWT